MDLGGVGCWPGGQTEQAEEDDEGEGGAHAYSHMSHRCDGQSLNRRTESAGKGIMKHGSPGWRGVHGSLPKKGPRYP